MYPLFNPNHKYHPQILASKKVTKPHLFERVLAKIAAQWAIKKNIAPKDLEKLVQNSLNKKLLLMTSSPKILTLSIKIIKAKKTDGMDLIPTCINR